MGRLPIAFLILTGCIYAPYEPDPLFEDAGTEVVVEDAGTVEPCTGCRLDGECKVGAGRTACGVGDVVCDVCSDRELCAEGLCVLTCDDTTCPAGCCRDGVCLPGTTDEACGLGTCSTCSGATLCRGQTCEARVTVTLTWGVRRDCEGDSFDCSVTRTMFKADWSSLWPKYETFCAAQGEGSDLGVVCGCPDRCCPVLPYTTPCAWNPPTD